MIQNRTHADRTVEGNLIGEDIKMGVKDMGHILNILTDMYSDRELACIREYSTNAWDAHVEAGVTSPIEVTTPSPLSPFLVVRDFGVGLTLGDIREIYSQYGASTKRHTNDQNGMLGIGCKAALTYADQFTVTSVKDGVRIQVVVARNTMGASMKVVDTADTDDANGTTVTIPARSGNQIESKAKDFFKYWEDGRALLDGKPVERLPGAQWAKPYLALINDDYYGKHRIVMGGVAYPAPTLDIGMGSSTKLVAFVDIGAIDFAPSREALMDTDTTQVTLRGVVKDLHDSIKQSVLDDIASAASPREAVEKRLEWGQKVPASMIPAVTPYKGRAVPDSIDVPDGTIAARSGHTRPQAAHSKLTKHAPAATILNALWVVGHDHTSFTATTKKKLTKYTEDKGASYPHFVLSKDKPDMFWIDGGVSLVKWEDIKAIKLPRNAPNPLNGRIPGSYDVFEDGDWNEGVPGDDIDQSAPIFWMFGKYYDGRRKLDWIKANYPGASLVMLRRGREDKFKRLFPKSREVHDVIKEDYEKWAKTVTADQKLALAVQDDSRISDWAVLEIDKIDDPRFKKIDKLRKLDLKTLKAKVREWYGLGFSFNPGDHGVEIPMNDYPLLPDMYYLRRRHQDLDHVWRYMNAEYAWKQEQS